MSALATPEAARRRSTNFFRGTMRGRAALADEVPALNETLRIDRAPGSALEIEALRVIRSNLQAKALSQGGQKLTDAQLALMLQTAQHTLRGMTDDQLKSVTSSGSTLESIVAASFNAVAATDAQRLAELEKLNATGGDGTGIDALRLLRGEDFRARISSAERQREMGSDRLSTEERAQIASATAMAMRLGMPWALNNPELLRLGPDAIRAIAATNLKETGYRALREGSHYEVKDIVTFAKHAKINGFDAEQAAHATRDLLQAQPADQQKALADVLKAYDRAVVDAHERPNDAGVRQRLEEAGQRQKSTLQGIAAQSPEQAEHVRKLEEAKKVEEHFRATAASNKAEADVDVAKRDADRGVADKKATKETDIFDAPDTPTQAKAPTTKAAEVAAPQTKAAAAKVDEKKITPKAATPAQPKLT